MKKEIKSSINLIKFIVIALALSIFACQPYLNNMTIYAHDLGYHLNRIMEISKNLDMNIFPSFIHSGLLNNLGYANSIFYPEIFLYIPAFLMSILDLHVYTVYKIFLILITFFTYIITYISTKEIFKNKQIAWISSLLYIFSLYRLTDIYVRGALGEVLSFIFIPLLFWGLYEIIFKKDGKWWLLPLALFGIANSHILTFILVIPILMLMCLVNIKEFVINKKKLINLIIAIIVSVVVCIGVFIPIIEQKLNDKFYVDEKISETTNSIKDRANSISMTLSSILKEGDAINSSINENEMSEGIGAILLILTSLFFFRKGINYKENRFEIQLIILGIVLCFMTTKLFPWEKFAFLNILQFPFRLNIIITICFVFVGAKSFYEVVENKKDSIIILTIGILVISGYVLNNVKVNINPKVYPNFESIIGGINQTGNSEYLPQNTDLEDIYLYNINDKENKLHFEQYGSNIEFDYTEEILPMEINIPLIYYKGYTASIIDKNGEKTKLYVEKNEKNGHVLVKSDEIITGKIVVEYKATPIQIISYVITYIALIGIIIFIIYDYKKRAE